MPPLPWRLSVLQTHNMKWCLLASEIEKARSFGGLFGLAFLNRFGGGTEAIAFRVLSKVASSSSQPSSRLPEFAVHGELVAGLAARYRPPTLIDRTELTL